MFPESVLSVHPSQASVCTRVNAEYAPESGPSVTGVRQRQASVYTRFRPECFQSQDRVFPESRLSVSRVRSECAPESYLSVHHSQA